MKYQLTYDQFVNEVINYDRIKQLNDKIATLVKRLSVESNIERKKHIEKQIKVNKLRLMIAQIG